VAAGYQLTLALRKDGTAGQLGNGSTENSTKPVIVSGLYGVKEVRTGTLSGVVAIAASVSHSLAVTGQQIVWGWGQNDSGSLGADAELLPRSDVPMRLGQSLPAECNALFSCRTTGGDIWIAALRTMPR
jgi:alpha-tubulin suppressor-like RCC1 family protein